MQEILTEKKTYPCQFCSMKFKSKVILDKHIKKHSEKKFACKICHKVYTRKDYLKIHMKYHSEENPFKCEECDLRFADKCHLQRHYKVHKRKKQSVCELCNKNLSSLRALKVHRLCHTGEKPHSCEMCNRGFASSHALRIHRRRIHEKKKSFSFQICEDYLSDIDSDHSRFHSENCKECKNPYVCEICDRRCKTGTDLANHKRFHKTKENISMKSEAGSLCSESTAEEAVTYSQFMRKNPTTYGKRSKNFAKDND